MNKIETLLVKLGQRRRTDSDFSTISLVIFQPQIGTFLVNLLLIGGMHGRFCFPNNPIFTINRSHVSSDFG